MPYELPIPPEAERDPRALEIFRLWLANRKQHCVLNVGFWQKRGLDEAQAWGVVLADTVHHIAHAHRDEYGASPEEVIAQIRESFDIEMDHPTSSRLGQFRIDRSE